MINLPTNQCRLWGSAYDYLCRASVEFWLAGDTRDSNHMHTHKNEYNRSQMKEITMYTKVDRLCVAGLMTTKGRTINLGLNCLWFYLALLLWFRLLVHKEYNTHDAISLGFLCVHRVRCYGGWWYGQFTLSLVSFLYDAVFSRANRLNCLSRERAARGMVGYAHTRDACAKRLIPL